jgi:hypothetical protein
MPMLIASLGNTKTFPINTLLASFKLLILQVIIGLQLKVCHMELQTSPGIGPVD